jgi:hypothetical protein
MPLRLLNRERIVRLRAMKKTLTAFAMLACVGLASCADRLTSPARSAKARTQPTSLATISDHGLPAAGTPVVAPRPSDEASKKQAAPTQDELQRAQAVGVWKQNESGVRWLRIRPDGTATMFVDPAGNWAAQAIIGDGLTIQIEWSIADGRAIMKSISGEPSTTFKAVTALYGADRDRAIEQLDDRKFVMLDDSDGSKSEWTRVGSDVSLPTAVEN